MIGIPYIKELFQNILNQSRIIEGRFHVCPHWAKEVNNLNIDEVIPNVAPRAKKYPVALMMPPLQRGQFHLTGQRSRDSFEIRMLFVGPAGYTGDNQVTRPSSAGVTTHTVDQMWHDMQRVAKDFLKVLDEVITSNSLVNDIFIESRQQDMIPVTNLGNDKACGVMVIFSLTLATGCEIEDYADNFLAAIKVPELIDSHPLHLDI